MSNGPHPSPKPQRVEKPWGYELWWAATPLYAGKILHVDAGQSLSLQMHREKDESSYLLSGRLRLTRGPSADELTTEEIGPGFTWRVEPGTVHSIEALDVIPEHVVHPGLLGGWGCRATQHQGEDPDEASR